VAGFSGAIVGIVVLCVRFPDVWAFLAHGLRVHTLAVLFALKRFDEDACDGLKFLVAQFLLDPGVKGAGGMVRCGLETACAIVLVGIGAVVGLVGDVGGRSSMTILSG